jgi:hypothetical protein
VDILRFFKFNALTASDLRKVNALKVNEFSLLKKLILSASWKVNDFIKLTFFGGHSGGLVHSWAENKG